MPSYFHPQLGVSSQPIRRRGAATNESYFSTTSAYVEIAGRQLRRSSTSTTDCYDAYSAHQEKSHRQFIHKAQHRSLVAAA
jgi:hypothetical protein